MLHRAAAPPITHVPRCARLNKLTELRRTLAYIQHYTANSVNHPGRIASAVYSPSLRAQMQLGVVRYL